MDELTASLTTATKALEVVEDYYSRVRDEADRSVRSVVHGFEAIVTPAQKARQEAYSLDEAFRGLTDAELNLHLGGEATIPTITNMTQALESQLQYLTDYQNAIAAARANGASDALLATLTDGTMESYDYLHALAQAGPNSEAIANLNALYNAVETERQNLATALTDTRLTADTEFQGLVDAAKAAADELDQYATAESSMAHTVQGIADGIAAQIPAVQAQVDALNAVLSRLGDARGATGGIFGSLFRINGSHAAGLDYVPFDNYLAQLHEGESILTAEEARVWRAFKDGGASIRNNIDYGALSGAIWENAPHMGGGNVYLDGQTVGRVISEAQGNSLRALERSGWQR
jgi:hypothetical protein